MKNILKPRINYSPLYHHVDDLQEQIFNTAWTTVLIHTQTYPSTKFPVHVIFLSIHFVFSKLHRIFALLCSSG